MKKYLSVIMVITMLFQSAPMVFAGNSSSEPVTYGGKGTSGSDSIMLFGEKAPATVNPGKGHQNNQNQGTVGYNNKGNKGNQIPNQGQYGQNSQAVQVVIPSQTAGMYGNAYVIQGIGNFRNFIRQGNQNGFPVMTQNGQAQQMTQNGINYQNMSKDDRAFLLELIKMQHQRDMVLLQNNERRKDEDRRMEYMQQQQLRQDAIRMQENRQRQNAMLIQMFGMMVPMTLMTIQQHRDSKANRRAYEREAERNRQFYDQLRRQRTRCPQRRYTGQNQSWPYNQYQSRYQY